MTLRLLDGRVRDTVTLPRFRMEEGLVDIQAASRETSTLLEKSARYIEGGYLPEAIGVLGHADTLVRGMGDTAWTLAGVVTACPDSLSGPPHGDAA